MHTPRSQASSERKRSFCHGGALAKLWARHGHMTERREGTLNLAEQEECRSEGLGSILVRELKIP